MNLSSLLTADFAGSLVRKLVVFGGGLLVAKGYGDAALVETAAGVAASLISILWSVVARKAAAPAA